MSQGSSSSDNKRKQAVLASVEKAKQDLRKLDWRELTFIGVEVNSIPEIYKEDFSFPLLEDALTEPNESEVNPPLSTTYPLYLFMGAQPIYEKGETLNVPYIVVIDCPSSPPSKIAHASIQGATEEIIEMKGSKFNWVPYFPKRYNDSLERAPPQIYHLNWTTRSNSMNKGKVAEDKLHFLEYLMPYIRIPSHVDKIVEEFNEKSKAKQTVRTVSFDFWWPSMTEEQIKEFEKKEKDKEKEKEKENAKANKAKPKAKGKEEDKKESKESKKSKKDTEKKETEKKEEKKEEEKKEEEKKEEDKGKEKEKEKEATPKKLFVVFDKEIDRLATFVPEFLDDNKLPSEAEEALTNAIKAAFEKKREEHTAHINSIKEEVAAYGDKVRNDYINHLRIYKFYPEHPKIFVRKFVSPSINRFFGDATQVYPPPLTDEEKANLAKLEEKFFEEVEKKRKEEEGSEKEDKEDKSKGKKKAAPKEKETTTENNNNTKEKAAATPKKKGKGKGKKGEAEEKKESEKKEEEKKDEQKKEEEKKEEETKEVEKKDEKHDTANHTQSEEKTTTTTTTTTTTSDNDKEMTDVPKEEKKEEEKKEKEDEKKEGEESEKDDGKKQGEKRKGTTKAAKNTKKTKENDTNGKEKEAEKETEKEPEKEKAKDKDEPEVKKKAGRPAKAKK